MSLLFLNQLFMKKTPLVLISFLFIIPSFALADSGPNYMCFSPKLTTEEAQKMIADGYPDWFDIKNEVRGTCKTVDISTVVSLDSALQKEYLLGKHESIGYNCARGEGCEHHTKYSESIYLTSSSTSTIKNLESSNFVPINFAVFDKIFFVSLLQKIYKDANVPFREKNISENNIYVFREDEFNVVKKAGDNGFLSGNIKMDALNAEHRGSYPSSLNNSDTVYDVYSLNYKEYGKYIHGPKTNLLESQYVNVGENSELSDSELQIRWEQSGRTESSPVVPLTSPLKSVTNYWQFTKKDDKLVLAWQKSEYGLDNGTTRTITNTDKNVSASLLFSDSFGDPFAISSSNEIQSLPEGQKVGFINRFFNWILSWFR